MKEILEAIVILFSIAGLGSLTAAQKWEGEDPFNNDASWDKRLGERGPNGSGGKMDILSGRVIASREQQSDYGVVWGWAKANRGRALSIPTGQCWEVVIEAALPARAPAGRVEKAGFGLVVALFPNQKAYRAVYVIFQGRYDQPLDALADTASVVSDFNFELLPSRVGGGPPEDEKSTSIGSRNYRMRFRHNALTQTDSCEIKDTVTQETLYARTAASTLRQTPTCNIVFGLGLEGAGIWPKSSSEHLSADNWSLLSFNPDPINLNTKTGISKGNSYSVAVSGLGMTGARLTGTVALTVGTNSATLPITGSIDRNGFFVLAARGTGANRGFGCALLYDVATGTYRPNKNTVTAPKQKAIKF